MSDKLIDSLADIETYGRRWERQRDLDSRYAPPKAAEEMRVKGAAYSAVTTKAKVAATEDEVLNEVAAVEKSSKRSNISKKKTTLTSEAGVREASAPATANLKRENNRRMQQSVAPLAREYSYADAVQGTQPVNTWSRAPGRFMQPRASASPQWAGAQGSYGYAASGTMQPSAPTNSAPLRAQFSRPAGPRASVETNGKGEFYGARFT